MTAQDNIHTEVNDIETSKLGTPEMALSSCVNLLSRLFNVSESYTACYLDMYYQLRLQYEAEKEAQEPKKGKRLKPPYQVKRTMNVPPAPARDEAPCPDADASGQEETGEDRAPLPCPPCRDAIPGPASRRAANGAAAELAEPLLPPPAAGHREAPAVFSGFEPLEVKPGGHKGAAEAAAEKRRIRDRLTQARAEGVTVRQIVKAGEGNITEDQIREILDSHKAPIAVYRVLDGALGVLGAAAGPT